MGGLKRTEQQLNAECFCVLFLLLLSSCVHAVGQLCGLLTLLLLLQRWLGTAALEPSAFRLLRLIDS